MESSERLYTAQCGFSVVVWGSCSLCLVWTWTNPKERVNIRSYFSDPDLSERFLHVPVSNELHRTPGIKPLEQRDFSQVVFKTKFLKQKQQEWEVQLHSFLHWAQQCSDLLQSLEIMRPRMLKYSHKLKRRDSKIRLKGSSKIVEESLATPSIMKQWNIYYSLNKPTRMIPFLGCCVAVKKIFTSFLMRFLLLM